MVGLLAEGFLAAGHFAAASFAVGFRFGPILDVVGHTPQQRPLAQGEDA